MKPDVGEHYAVSDGVLPLLRSMNEPVEIRVDVDELYVTLTIGETEHKWRRGFPEPISSLRKFAERRMDPEDM